MKVNIKSFDVAMEVKNKGFELDVYDNDGRHLGDLVVTKTKLILCKGRTDRKNAIAVTWDKFIKYMQEK